MRARARRGFALFFLLLLLATGCIGVQVESEVVRCEPEAATPRRLILMIGDGMGLPQLSLARMVEPEGRLALDGFPVTGIVTTRSADQWVTDSAASATAYATGRLTVNGRLGLDARGDTSRTVLEGARDRGLAVGVVTTTRVTHATPAAFYAHANDRDREEHIAGELEVAGLDVILGGGRARFGKRRATRLLDRGYAMVHDREALLAAPGPRLIGLFADAHLPFELDRDPAEVPSLAEMTRKALEILEADPEGFFLLVEGGRIDHARPVQDAPSVAAEVRAFDRACVMASAFVELHPETLLVVTADHATGGMGIAVDVDVERLRAVRSSAETLAKRIKDGGEDPAEVLAGVTGVKRLVRQDREAIERAAWPNLPALVVGNVVSRRLGVHFFPLWVASRPAAANGHDGSAVGLYAMGCGAEAFAGTRRNADVGRLLFRALGLEGPEDGVPVVGDEDGGAGGNGDRESEGGKARDRL